MNNYKMKARNVLMLIAMLCSVGQVLSLKRFYLSLDAWRTIDNVQSELGRQIVSHIPEQVFTLLAETKNDDQMKTNTILNRYSVHQLLELNNWNINECFDDGLTKRRKTCESFSNKQTVAIEPNEGSGITADDITQFNLARYCSSIVQQMELKCPLERVLHLINYEDMSKFYAFKSKVLGSGLVNPSISAQGRVKLNKILLAWIIKMHIGKEPKEQKNKLLDTCSLIVNELGSHEKTLESDWRISLEFCTIMIQKITKE